MNVHHFLNGERIERLPELWQRRLAEALIRHLINAQEPGVHAGTLRQQEANDGAVVAS